MSDVKDREIPSWGLPAFSWLISFYFLLGFVANVGFPPERALFLGDALFIFLWLFFVFLPFFSRIKIGNLIELEREIQRTKKDLQDVKTELRNNIALLSTTVNTIGSMTNQVTVNIPGLAELQHARQDVTDQAPPESKEEAEQVEQVLRLEGEDTTMALARTRIEIERLLRGILGKRTSVNALREDAIKYLGARQLFEMFVKENEQYRYLLKPFLNVNQVCNAAIHAQRVPEPQAEEALSLGAQIIAVLREVGGAGIA